MNTSGSEYDSENSSEYTSEDISENISEDISEDILEPEMPNNRRSANIDIINNNDSGSWSSTVAEEDPWSIDVDREEPYIDPWLELQNESRNIVRNAFTESLPENIEIDTTNDWNIFRNFLRPQSAIAIANSIIDTNTNTNNVWNDPVDDYRTPPLIDNIDQLADMINSYQNNTNIRYLPIDIDIDEDGDDEFIENEEVIDTDGAECHICLCDKNDKQILDKSINNLKVIPDNSIFASPCKKHFICKECFIKIALDFENNPINSTHSLIRCLYSGRDCVNDNGFFTYFNNNQVKRILNKEQYKLYIEHAERFKFPGFKLENCPSIRCHSRNLISIEDINSTSIGNLIIECTQTHYCEYRYCYNCKRRLREYQICCNICINLEDSSNPHSYNYFLIKEEEFRKIQSDYLYKQKEISVDMAVNHIKEIIYSSDSRFSIQCPVCLNHFYKSEKCAGLRHCGIERCYSCGKIQNELNQELNDHWSEIGNKGCPRFDNAYYWNEIANCEFECSENTYEDGCYNHELGECTNYKHETGIINMVNERKQAFIYNFLKSLLKNIRNSVIEEMKDILDKPFLDKVFLFIEKHNEHSGDYTPIVFIDKLL